MNPEWRPAMRDLARRVAEVQPPEGVEAAVFAEFDRTFPHSKSHAVRPSYWAIAAALAASLLVGALLVRPQPARSPAPSAQSTQSPEQEFYPIPYTPPLQPYERVLVVQTDVPVTALRAAGFRVQTSDPGGSVRADVMVSQDGRPRAIRPVVFSVSDRR